MIEEGPGEEGHRVHTRLPSFVGIQGRHDLGPGLAHQVGNLLDGITMRAQPVDQHRQRGHGDAAVAASVVQQDNAAAELRLGLHGL